MQSLASFCVSARFFRSVFLVRNTVNYGFSSGRLFTRRLFSLSLILVMLLTAMPPAVAGVGLRDFGQSSFAMAGMVRDRGRDAAVDAWAQLRSLLSRDKSVQDAQSNAS